MNNYVCCVSAMNDICETIVNWIQLNYKKYYSHAYYNNSHFDKSTHTMVVLYHISDLPINIFLNYNGDIIVMCSMSSTTYTFNLSDNSLFDNLAKCIDDILAMQ